MQRSDLLATVERLCDIELDVLDRDALAGVVAATAQVRGWLDALELRCARQGRSLADAGRAEPSAELIARNTNRTSREADQISRRDRVAEAMPTFEAGLDDGVVSAGHLDAIAAATRHAPPEVRATFALHEDELLGFAATDTVEAFARRCRALVTELTTEHTGNDASELERQRAASSIRTWFSDEDGLHHTHAALDPLRHEIFWTALNRSIRRRQQHDGNARTPWNQIQVDALIDLVTGHTPTEPPTPPTDHARGDTTTGTAADTRAAEADRTSNSSGGSSGSGGGSGGGSSTGRPSGEQAPSPAADIARDLSEAIDRSNGVVGLDDLDNLDDLGDLDDLHDLDDLGDRGTGHRSTATSAAPFSPPGDADHDAAETASDRPPDAVPSDVLPPDALPPDVLPPDVLPPDVLPADVRPTEAPAAELRRIEQRLPEICVVTELSVLIGGMNASGLCETQDGVPLPVSTLRRLCCDAEILPIVLSGDGIPLDVGRSSRTVTPAQRRALRALHRTCGNRSCPVPFSHTKIHHVRFWTRDRGPTDIENLIPLCDTCHHLVHEGGWTLTMTPERIATWTRPDGTIHYHGPISDRPPPHSDTG